MAIALLLLPVSVAAASGAESDRPQPVTVATVEDLGFFPVFSAPATSVSVNDTRISAEISGLLAELPAQVGDRVPADGILARLECDDHEFGLDQARAMVAAERARRDLAEFQLGRAQQLAQTQSVSAEIVNEREAESKRSQAEFVRLLAQFRAAERRVEKCVIRSPFDAVVIERMASLGELASPGSLLMRILDLANLEVSARVQEQDVESLRRARLMRFRSGSQPYPLRLRTVVPFVDPQLRSVEVRFRFLGDAASPGTVGPLEWISTQRHVPSDLLVRRGDALGVFIEQDAVARFFALEDALEGRPPAVDLSPDTRIVLEGRHGLQDGASVLVVEPR